MLRFCMMIDNINVIREVSEKFNVYLIDESVEVMLYDKDF